MDVLSGITALLLLAFIVVAGYLLALKYISWMQKEKKKHKTFYYGLGVLGAGLNNFIGDREFYNELEKEHPSLFKAVLVIAIVSIIVGLFTGYWLAWLLVIAFLIGIFYVIIISPRKSSSK